VCCSVLQCVAVYCNVLQYIILIKASVLQLSLSIEWTHHIDKDNCNTLVFINIMYCNTLQYTATHCNTLQHTANEHIILIKTTAMFSTSMFFTSMFSAPNRPTHCNTLQHTATHWEHYIDKDNTNYIDVDNTNYIDKDNTNYIDVKNMFCSVFLHWCKHIVLM